MIARSTLLRTLARPGLLLGAALIVFACGDGGGGAAKDGFGRGGGDASMTGSVAPAPPMREEAASYDMKMAAAPDARDRPVDQPLPNAAQDTGAPQALIKTGNATVRIDSLELAVQRIRALASGFGGYVSDVSLQTGEAQAREGTLTMRVPAARFDTALASLAGVGKVEFVNVSTEDVGEELVDVNARLENARRLEQRLITLLTTRAGRLEEILAVERELARVRLEIERYEGRLRFLRARVALSTLAVTLREPAPLVVGNARGGRIIMQALRNSWHNFVRFVAGFIESLGVLIPLAVLGLVGYVIIRRRYPNRRPDPRRE
jgi:hypothetical protein